MPRIRLFHWNATEAKPLIGQLRAGGYTVDYPSDKPLERGFRSLRESPPHAIVIDLTRLPSETASGRSDPIQEDDREHSDSLRRWQTTGSLKKWRKQQTTRAGVRLTIDTVFFYVFHKKQG